MFLKNCRSSCYHKYDIEIESNVNQKTKKDLYRYILVFLTLLDLREFWEASHLPAFLSTYIGELERSSWLETMFYKQLSESKLLGMFPNSRLLIWSLSTLVIFWILSSFLHSFTLYYLTKVSTGIGLFGLEAIFLEKI